MSGTRPNKVVPSTVTQEESATGDYNDTELEIGSFAASDTLTEFEVDVSEIFDGTTPVASIGIDANHEKYLTEEQCDLTVVGTYIIRDTTPMTGNETIKVFIDGDGAVQGSLTAKVRFLDT